ncbi:HD domain-containing protein [Trichothermofontia sp.]
MTSPTPLLSDRFATALTYAFQLHRHQVRKISGTPYIGHLLSVTALVLAIGGNEDEAIAALLHDALEDQGGEAIRAEIKHRFGEQVVAIVEGCSEVYTHPKPPWVERKQHYLDQLRQAPLSVLLVSLADKLDNARSLITDLALQGTHIWQAFKGGREQTLWFYQELLTIYRQRLSSPYVTELEKLIHQLTSL